MKKYLLTGISGFVGRKVLEYILDSEKYEKGEIDIYGVVRNKRTLNEEIKQKINIIEGDICNKDFLERFSNGTFDYIIHCAALTQSIYMISNPVETADAIVIGTKNMLELARRCNVKSMVYISSMEAYGTVADIGRLRVEHELGDIDLTSTRSCYSLGKRMAEHYCHIYQQEYDVPVKIARLAQTFGTGVNPADNRVYMQFARAAVEKKDIVLKTQGTSIGNYCAIDDVVEAIFTILYRGVNGEVYNVVNEENTMSIRDMAELVANQIAEKEICVRVEIEDSKKTGYAPDTGLRMSAEKLRALGWKPTKGIVDMYRGVINELN